MVSPRELPVTAADGVSSVVSVFETDELPPDSPILLVKPAMGIRASFYAPLAAPFNALGFRVATADLRGHGFSSVRPGRRTDFGFREMLELDWPAEIDVLADAWPQAPRVLLGHSLGGKLSLLYAAAHPDTVNAVVTCAACSVYWRTYPRGLALLAFTQLAAGVARLLGHFPGERLGFAGREAPRVMSDWARQSRTGLYRPRGSRIDYESLAARSTVPTLIMTLAGDRYAPPSAADHLAAKLPPEQVTRQHLEEPRIPSAHFRWVQASEGVVPAIHSWLLDQGIGERRSGRR